MHGRENERFEVRGKGGADLARNGPTVLALAHVLGLNDDQIDDMFRKAAALEV